MAEEPQRDATVARHRSASREQARAEQAGQGAHRARHARPSAPRRRWPGVAVLSVVAALGLGAGGTAVVTSVQDGRTVPSSVVGPVAGLPSLVPPVASGPARDERVVPRTGRPGAQAAPAPGLPGPVDADLLAGLADALFDADAGDFTDKFENSGDSGLVERAGLPRVVADPDDPNRSAWRFSLGSGGKRSEVLPQGRGTKPTDGDEQWIRYSGILGDDFPTDTDSWQLILQWHHASATGSPPLALQVTGGQLKMVSEGTDMQTIGPVSPGQRVDLVMHVVFDRDPSRGAVTVWRDGRPTGVTDWHPPDGTMSTRTAYLKMGMYRDPNIRRAGSVTVTDLKIGPTARSVGGTGDLPD